MRDDQNTNQQNPSQGTNVPNQNGGQEQRQGNYQPSGEKGGKSQGQNEENNSQDESSS